MRLVTLNDNGNVLVGKIRSTTDVTAFQEITIEFDEPPDHIKEYRLESRLYEQVEISPIALDRK